MNSSECSEKKGRTLEGKYRGITLGGVRGVCCCIRPSGPPKLPERCDFNAKLECSKSVVNSDSSSLTVFLKNTQNNTLVLDDFKLSDNQGLIEDSTGLTCKSIMGEPFGDDLTNDPLIVRAGQNFKIEWKDCYPNGITEDRGYIIGDGAKFFVKFSDYEEQEDPETKKAGTGEVYTYVK